MHAVSLNTPNRLDGSTLRCLTRQELPPGGSRHLLGEFSVADRASEDHSFDHGGHHLIAARSVHRLLHVMLAARYSINRLYRLTCLLALLATTYIYCQSHHWASMTTTNTKSFFFLSQISPPKLTQLKHYLRRPKCASSGQNTAIKALPLVGCDFLREATLAGTDPIKPRCAMYCGESMARTHHGIVVPQSGHRAAISLPHGKHLKIVFFALPSLR